MQRVKIFVASSGELNDERKKCIEICHQVNKYYPHLKLEVVEWETDIPSGSYGKRIQDEINPLLVESDIVIVMFFSKVGKFTFEEYKLAVTSNKKVFLYFKKGFSASNKKELNNYAKVLKLSEQLDKENQSLYVKYDTIDVFTNKVQNDLELYLTSKYGRTTPLPINNSSKNLTILPTKPIELIGRGDTLQDIDTILDEEKRVLLVNGLGGIGKTEVCKKYFWDNYDKFKYIGWIDYVSNLKESFVNQLTLDIAFTQEENIDERYLKIMKHLSSLNSNSLIVIDNIENMQDENIDDISRFPFKVIASSRQSSGNVFKEYNLEFLSMDCCKKLFTKHYGGIKLDENAWLEHVIQLAGYHTLTIELLAKTAKCAGIRVKALYEKLNEYGFSLEGIKETVDTKWHNTKDRKIFFDHLQKVFELSNVSDGEKYILTNLSILPPLPLPKDAIRVLLGLESLNDLNFLVNKGWLNEKEQDIIMHQVISEVVKRKLQPNVKYCEKLINSFSRLLKYEAGDNPFDKVGYIVYGEYILKNLNEDNQNIATLLNNLSLIYKAKGELEKALEYQLKVVEIFEKVLGKEHPALATSYNNLSLIYQDKGELEKALEYQLKAVEIIEKVLGKEHPYFATSYNNLSSIYQDKGELEKALEYQLKAVEIREKVLGKEHPDLATSYNYLSSIYQDKGELDKALEYQLKAVEIREKVLRKEHPSLAQSYNNLSSIYQAKGELEKALEYQLKAIEISEKVLGKEHPASATSYNNLSQIYKAKGELEKALEYQMKAVEILFNKFPNGHPNLNVVIRILGELLQQMQGENKLDFFPDLLKEHPNYANIISKIFKLQEE